MTANDDDDYFKRFSRMANMLAEARAELLEIATLYEEKKGARLSVMTDGPVSRVRKAIGQLSISVHEVREEALGHAAPKAKARK